MKNVAIVNEANLQRKNKIIELKSWDDTVQVCSCKPLFLHFHVHEITALSFCNEQVELSQPCAKFGFVSGTEMLIHSPLAALRRPDLTEYRLLSCSRSIQFLYLTLSSAGRRSAEFWRSASEVEGRFQSWTNGILISLFLSPLPQFFFSGKS